MKIESRPEAVRAWSRAARADGLTVGFVPTMGALHAGHWSLVEAARAAGADTVIVSIFVNPTQFGPDEDLDAYPRDLDGDADKLRALGVDLIFQPEVTTMYPPGAETSVTLARLPQHLCGIDRPVHFGGVATVVTTLFNIVEPHLAVFGEKDFQQLQVIRRLVRDLWFDIRVVGAPIVRESDGLAMSSRNAYLDPADRSRARCLSQSLDLAEQMARDGVEHVPEMVDAMTAIITGAGAEVDYVRIVDQDTLNDLRRLDRPARAVVAARLGRTRLIDNRRIEPVPARAGRPNNRA